MYSKFSSFVVLNSFIIVLVLTKCIDLSSINLDKKQNIELSTNKSSNSVVISSDDYVTDEELDKVIERIQRESVIFDMANYVSDDMPLEELLRLIELSEAKATTTNITVTSDDKSKPKTFIITKLFQNNAPQAPVKIFIKPMKGLKNNRKN